MSVQQHNFHATSLDFINRPNPVEPSNVRSNHESTCSKQLESRTNGDFVRVLRDSRLDKPSRNAATPFGVPRLPPAKNGQGTGAATLGAFGNGSDEFNSVLDSAAISGVRDPGHGRFMLPPPAQRGVKRARPQAVPPVLQGLHQPPPNAGLLPSIDTEDRRTRVTSIVETPVQPSVELPGGKDNKKVGAVFVDLPIQLAARPGKRNKWSDVETATLLKGVQRFGAGSWKKILTCPDYSFNSRTATDLKDRYRVVSSNKDIMLHFKICEAHVKDPPDLSGESHLAATTANGKEQRQMAGSTEQELPKAKRRQRTKWTDEEDEALLRGFGRYGPSWTSIQLDPVLKKRTPTDIRDRIRTRYSEQYRKTGLAPKSSKPRTQMRSSPVFVTSAGSTKGPPDPPPASSKSSVAAQLDHGSGTRPAQATSTTLPKLIRDLHSLDRQLPVILQQDEAFPFRRDEALNQTLPSMSSLF